MNGNLLRWYNKNIEISKQKLSEESKLQNDFWIRWEKQRLTIKRIITHANKRNTTADN
jgi:hypothetical protein